MKRVVIPIEFCNDCRYAVLVNYVTPQKVGFYCEKQERMLVAFPSAYEEPNVKIPEDCPLPEYKE